MGITAGRKEDLCTGMLVNEFSLPLGPKQKLKRYIGPGRYFTKRPNMSAFMCVCFTNMQFQVDLENIVFDSTSVS